MFAYRKNFLTAMGLVFAATSAQSNVDSLLKEVQFKGLASASYNYNFNRPADLINSGKTFEKNANQFMFHKMSFSLNKEAKRSSSEFGAGFYTQIYFGEDGLVSQSAGLGLGGGGDLKQAFIEANIPLGNGLKVLLGKYNSPLGYESPDYEFLPLWSTGLQQALFTATTHTGAVFDYKVGDAWDLQLHVNNGWDVVIDNNRLPTLMGVVTFAPVETLSVQFCGYGGPEQAGSDDNWRKGIELIAAHKPLKNVGTTFQLDYAHESNKVPSGDAQWLALAVWLTYDFSDSAQAAFRADYANDFDGGASSGSPATAPLPINNGQQLYSLALAFNYRPVSNLRLAPELRFDGSTLANGYDGKSYRITTGLGAVYFF